MKYNPKSSQLKLNIHPIAVIFIGNRLHEPSSKSLTRLFAFHYPSFVPIYLYLFVLVSLHLFALVYLYSFALVSLSVPSCLSSSICIYLSLYLCTCL